MSGYPINWNLDSLYEGGSRSAAFEKLLKKCDKELSGYDEKLESLPGTPGDEWAHATIDLQNIAMNLWEAISFVECLQAQDTDDSAADQLMDRVEMMSARQKTFQTRLVTCFLSATDEDWKTFLERPDITGSAFYLDEQREVMRLKMKPEMEVLAEELATDGYHAWGRLYEKIAGSLRTEWSEDGKITHISMGQLHNKMEDPDRKVRRLAFEKLEETWKGTGDLTAMALNYQAGFRLNLYKNRGWDSVIQEPLRINRIRRETLETMWGVVAEESPRLVPYMNEKCRILGINKMYWYDQSAPVGKSIKKYSYDEAADFILEHFGAFSTDMRDFAATALKKGWLETEDRPGKRAGGFCTDFPVKRETRIFSTFGGTYGGLATIGHELGHSYHTWLVKDRPFYSTLYPMTLAETASTFCETLLLDAALEAASSDEERLALLGQKAEEATTMLMNLRSRFLFETSFFDAREKTNQSVEDLNGLMVAAQKKAYCDNLDPEGYHPYFWASKLHFYITSMPFYNFPYVFGYLFSNGIYDRAVQEGSGFAGKYVRLLQDTGVMTCEEVAEKHLGVDLSRPDFWKSAVDRILEGVDRFMEYSGKA